MTGWQIAGNVAMIGLNFAPALGAAGGVALKKLIGPDFLKLGGCFVAGTPVHLSALPVAVSALELAYASSASDRFSYDLGFAWEEPHAEPAVVVPIEQVPLGARIDTKNPEAFGAENPKFRMLAQFQTASVGSIHDAILRHEPNMASLRYLFAICFAAS